MKLPLCIKLVIFLICSVHSYEIPNLKFEERSDWINVKNDFGAIADGKADDTAALQKALDQLTPFGHGKKVIYLPAGTYRITKMLTIPKSVGISILGHGKSTVINWDGDTGGTMIWSNGSVHSRYEGIVWNGKGKAGVGFHHFAKDKFENKILHRNEVFIGFTKAGILMGKQNPFASSESTIKNCWFENCEKGISIIDFNYYNEVAEACEFRDCRHRHPLHTLGPDIRQRLPF